MIITPVRSSAIYHPERSSGIVRIGMRLARRLDRREEIHTNVFSFEPCRPGKYLFPIKCAFLELLYVAGSWTWGSRGKRKAGLLVDWIRCCISHWIFHTMVDLLGRWFLGGKDVHWEFLLVWRVAFLGESGNGLEAEGAAGYGGSE